MNNTLKALASVAVLVSTTQLAHAHAGFKDQITEGTVKTWNAVNIGHGCASNATPEGGVAFQKDVIAISTIFPNPSDIKDVTFRGSKGAVATTGAETPIDNLAAYIVGSTDTVASTIAISAITAGGTMFANTIPVYDNLNKVRGFQGWSGTSPFNGSPLLESAKKFDPAAGTNTTVGLAPFGISAIQFKPDSCAKKLVIRVAIADWCLKGTKNAADDSRVDVWIGAKTPKFNDQDVMPNATDAIFWPGLTVNRDLVKNPLPGTKGFDPAKIAINNGIIDRTVPGWEVSAAKAAAGTTPATPAVTSDKVTCGDTDYDTVYIEPNANDIDKYLPISTAKYPAGANGAVYWPSK
jgi:hypothetical protein